MIDPKQIPDEVVISAREAWLRSDVNAQSDWRVAIAAALNAWPGAQESGMTYGKISTLIYILPLSIEEQP